MLKYCKKWFLEDLKQPIYKSYTEFAYWSYKILKILLILEVFLKNFNIYTPIIFITSD